MTIWHLQLFVAVAETGSMSAAAKQYMIRQPSVSQKISELESHYGVLLFERLGNRLHITEAGEKLLPLARDLTSRFNFLEDYMESQHAVNRLRIGATITIGSSILPQFIERYRCENPDTEIFASISNTASISQKLVNNELDIALVEGVVKSLELVSTPKLKDFLVLACGKGHPFYSKPSLHSQDLQDMDFVMREPGSGTRELFEQYLARHHVHIKIALEYNNPEAMRQAILVNRCMAVISVRLLEDAARANEVRLFQSQGQEWNRTFNLVYHKNKHVTKAMRRFCTLLDQCSDWTNPPLLPMRPLLD